MAEIKQCIVFSFWHRYRNRRKLSTRQCRLCCRSITKRTGIPPFVNISFHVSRLRVRTKWFRVAA
jgi:hypothetical protein